MDFLPVLILRLKGITSYCVASRLANVQIPNPLESSSLPRHSGRTIRLLSLGMTSCI